MSASQLMILGSLCESPLKRNSVNRKWFTFLLRTWKHRMVVFHRLSIILLYRDYCELVHRCHDANCADLISSNKEVTTDSVPSTCGGTIIELSETQSKDTCISTNVPYMETYHPNVSCRERDIEQAASYFPESKQRHERRQRGCEHPVT